jgi:hypothetical protein
LVIGEFILYNKIMGVDKGFDFYPPLTDSDVDKVSRLPDNVKEYSVLTTSLKI